MLRDQITNPWIRFWLESTPTKEVAREAFLYVIMTYTAVKTNKKAMLDAIVKKFPQVLGSVSDKADGNILKAFLVFSAESRRRGYVISILELGWVGEYVKDPMTRRDIERAIFLSLMEADEYWDEVRRKALGVWTLTNVERRTLIRGILECSDRCGVRRKIELAKEIGVPHEEFTRKYFEKLLLDRHYDRAAELAFHDPDAVMNTIFASINAGRFCDALEIASRFIPDLKKREEARREIKEIQKALK